MRVRPTHVSTGQTAPRLRDLHSELGPHLHDRRPLPTGLVHGVDDAQRQHWRSHRVIVVPLPANEFLAGSPAESQGIENGAVKRGFGPVVVSAVCTVLMTTGCHDADARDEGQPIVVRVEYPPNEQAIFVEGAVTELRLHNSHGSTMAEKEARTTVPVLLGAVSPGRYSLQAAVRPCDGNCDHLDPAAFKCRGDVVVPDAGDARVIVTINSKDCVVLQQPDV